MAKLVIGTSNQAVVPSIVKRVEVPMPTSKYSLLDRVVDDSNNSIGTVVGFFIDANNVEYAVVCLDAAYRLASSQFAQYATIITPRHSAFNVLSARETATANCDAILSAVSAAGYTSTAVSHCRAQTFTIDGVSYAGQLPNVVEVVQIFQFRTQVNSLDPTASQYPSLIIPTGRLGTMWSSNPCGERSAYLAVGSGDYPISYTGQDSPRMAAPVLEIPNAL